MSGYTLISSLGTGMYKKDGYRKTLYRFSDTLSISSTLFMRAVLESKRRNITKVILVGTRTSSWDALVPDDENADADLWCALKEECACEPGISDERIAELTEKLPAWYGGIGFEIKAHTPRLDTDTVPSVFSVYMDLSREIARQKSRILLDITHGFRSMPMLMYQALQFDTCLSSEDVEIIYGEYIDGQEVSPVRKLSGFWGLSKIAQAKRLFESKLNGKPLAAEIRPHWEAGAKCLERLSEVVECNYSLQIPEVLKQINNAVKNFDDAAPHAPQWVVDVKNDLAEIISKRLTVKDGEKYPVSKTVLKYAKLLAEKSLTTQAVIALQVAVETAVTEHLDPSKIGDYRWFHGYYDRDSDAFVKGEGRRHLNRLKKQSRNLDPLGNLEDLRNNIAHGGSKDRNGNQPHQANIPGILKEAFGAMDALYLNLQ